ncbi:MAG: N-acetylmuramoyl-L-alanine amidase, partial [Clostridia bacterium]|nr:N-acetylmuramoyl-L-alanine amidase [Clostridia bacterium]
MKGVILLFLSVKGYQIWFLLLTVLGILCLGLLPKAERTETAAGLPIEGRVIVADAGHGGFDGGASGGGVSEKDVNLSVAHKLREYIEQGGGIVVMTRREDVSTAEKN